MRPVSAWVGGSPGSDPVQWQWLDGKKITDTFWAQATPDVKSGQRVRISNNGLGTHSATGTKDAFVIEWDR